MTCEELQFDDLSISKLLEVDSLFQKANYQSFLWFFFSGVLEAKSTG